ncbi:MAG: type II toxin-antitoxin system PemK/MazF family toxin [Pseudomonadota bacterium]
MKQGEIWEIELDPTVGAEMRKRRPAVIVSDDAIGSLPLRVVVPITEWKDHYQGAVWMVRVETDGLNNLSKTSVADAFQIRSVSINRFAGKIGAVSPAVLNEIKTAAKAVIDAE